MATVVVQAGYMSGDMFGTAAALKLDRDLYVVVVYDKDDEGQAKKMVELYKTTLKDFSADKKLDYADPAQYKKANDRTVVPDNPRVKLLRVTSSEAFYSDMQQSSRLTLAQKRNKLGSVLPSNILQNAQFRAMGATTEAVTFHFELDKVRSQLLDKLQLDLANLDGDARYRKLNELARKSSGDELVALKAMLKFRSQQDVKSMVKYHFDMVGNTRRSLIEQWRLQDLDELAIQRFLQHNGILFGQKYVFLWVRQSGKAGGAHREHDSSRFGWQQLVDQLERDNKYVPVLIGDSFPNKKQLTSSRGTLRDLTEFWKETPFSLYTEAAVKDLYVGAEARLSQFALFDYMQRAEYKVCHLGMRSGVLESVALMGAPVIYMEEIGNSQGPRVQAMAQSMDNYQRLQLQNLSSHKGKDFQRKADDSWIKTFKDAKGDLARHSKESFRAVSERIARMERKVPTTGTFANFLSEYVSDAAPTWKARHFGDASNWAAYKAMKGNNAWATKFETLLNACYQERASRGFEAPDMTNIMTKLTARLG